MKLGRNFFSRSADVVARDLLGKILVKKINGKILYGRIVETEAYFGEEDPASRACQNGDLRKTMKMDAGTILVYGVHNNWLLNFVTSKNKIPEAVLIRAIEPLNFSENCSGPGLLTKALGIDKGLHKANLFKTNDFWVDDNVDKVNIVRGFRVGVKKDLNKKLRFYVKGNKFVSKK